MQKKGTVSNYAKRKITIKRKITAKESKDFVSGARISFDGMVKFNSVGLLIGRPTVNSLQYIITERSVDHENNDENRDSMCHINC